MLRKAVVGRLLRCCGENRWRLPLRSALAGLLIIYVVGGGREAGRWVASERGYHGSWCGRGCMCRGGGGRSQDGWSQIGSDREKPSHRRIRGFVWAKREGEAEAERGEIDLASPRAP